MHTSPLSTDGIDFEGGPKSVIFEESITSNGSASVTFRTLNDCVFEGEEVFLVNLTAMDPNVGTDKDQGVVVIKDQTSERTMGDDGGVGSVGKGHSILLLSIRG